MSLTLPSDRDAPLQSHLDELSIRLSRILAVFVMSMLISWYFIDGLLNEYFSVLSPCQDCTSVYSPTEWVSLRWLSIFLISLFLSLPFLFREIIKFSNPGLMFHERKWLKQLFFIGTIVISISVSLTLFLLLPNWFSYAHNAGLIDGVTAKYSASSMLKLAIVICYVEVLLFLSIISAILLRNSGIAQDENKFPWQMRIHGITIFLMWIIVPSEYDTLLFLGILLELISVEYCFLNFYPGINSIPHLKPNQGILDSEARLRRIAIVGCSCCGIVNLPDEKSIPKGVLYFPMSDFCVNEESQNLVLEYAVNVRLTDLIITGCSHSLINKKLLESLEFLDCQIRTLSLIDFHSIRTVESKITDIDFQVRMAVESDPWVFGKSFDRVSEKLSRIDKIIRPDVAYWTSLEKPPFGTDISPNEIIITSVNNPEAETILEFEKLGINLLHLPDYLIK
ncbi:MAG: hypothetical protein CMB56_003285 [Methanobacteriota archaeon]|nr:MAG: hypothetical protein CMB56_003285 [Euryarchaeota archaeon]